MRIIENILKNVVLDKAVITEKEALSESAYRLRLKSESFQNVNFIPGSFLRMGIGIGQDELSMKDKIRSYSVWNIDQSNESIDIAVATHSHGIGALWAKECQPGDTVYFKWKKGNFLADVTADSYIMIGDLSALSHLYIVNRNIGNNKQVFSIIYGPGKSELFPDIDGKLPFDFHDFPENPSLEIISNLKEIIPNLKGNKMVYIAGDSRVCIALNSFFRKELNWNTKQIKTKPFWNPEKKGLE